MFASSVLPFAPSEAITVAGCSHCLCGLEVMDILRTLGRAREDVSFCRMLLTVHSAQPTFFQVL